MNIDDYRAMKAELEQKGANTDAQTESSATTGTTPPEQAEVETPSAPPEETKSKETSTSDEQGETLESTKLPETIEIDGKEIPIDELKNGYMRQSDYTKKTQEARRLEQQAKEALEVIEKIKKDPAYSKQLSKDLNVPLLDPEQAQYTELENRYFDLYIETEINKLTSKYGEFDVEEVLTTARDANIEDLDTAYHVVQSRKGGGGSEVNVDSIKEQLRAELLQELQSQQESNVDTTSIIQSGGGSAPTKTNAPTLSTSEVKVARNMGLSPSEYAKWRDAK